MKEMCKVDVVDTTEVTFSYSVKAQAFEVEMSVLQSEFFLNLLYADILTF
jgi:hypothetical protein